MKKIKSGTCFLYNVEDIVNSIILELDVIDIKYEITGENKDKVFYAILHEEAEDNEGYKEAPPFMKDGEMGKMLNE